MKIFHFYLEFLKVNTNYMLRLLQEEKFRFLCYHWWNVHAPGSSRSGARAPAPDRYRTLILVLVGRLEWRRCAWSGRSRPLCDRWVTSTATRFRRCCRGRSPARAGRRSSGADRAGSSPGTGSTAAASTAAPPAPGTARPPPTPVPFGCAGTFSKHVFVCSSHRIGLTMVSSCTVPRPLPSWMLLIFFILFRLSAWSTMRK